MMTHYKKIQNQNPRLPNLKKRIKLRIQRRRLKHQNLIKEVHLQNKIRNLELLQKRI